MLERKWGDIFSSTAECITIPVNCKGVMGAGLALQFREKYPDLFKEYQSQCISGVLAMGKPSHIEDTLSTRTFMMFPTKDHWQEKSDMSKILDGLHYWTGLAKRGAYTYKSVAFPLLGAGLGGLDKTVVLHEIQSVLTHVENMEIEIWEK